MFWYLFPLSLVFGHITEGYVNLPYITLYLTNCTIAH